jgi:hypothetical protein
MTEALFVLSTGRCGTQWLASVLQQVCGDSAEVRHEPLGDDYAPREMLAAGHPAKLDPDLAEPIPAHVDAIEQTLTTRSYIECGHPSWSTMPYLIERFAGRIRVVHLVRHPVPTAWSWVSQQAYCPPMSSHLLEKVLLSPFDEGIRFASFRDRWPMMNPYEKALFYWAEVNAFGLDLRHKSAVPWMQVRFEDLLRGADLSRLLVFAGLDAAAATVGMVDEFRAHSGFWCDSRVIARHPEVLEVAAELGYDPFDFDESKLRQRYYAR